MWGGGSVLGRSRRCPRRRRRRRPSGRAAPAVPAPPSSPNKPGSSSSAGRLTAGPLPRRSGVLDRVRAIPPRGKNMAPSRSPDWSRARRERSRARRPDREASGVPGLGPDHAGTRVPPACPTFEVCPPIGRRGTTTLGLELARDRKSAVGAGPEVLGRWRLAWAFPVSPPRTDGRAPSPAPGWLIRSRNVVDIWLTNQLIGAQAGLDLRNQRFFSIDGRNWPRAARRRRPSPACPVWGRGRRVTRNQTAAGPRRLRPFVDGRR